MLNVVYHTEHSCEVKKLRRFDGSVFELGSWLERSDTFDILIDLSIFLIKCQSIRRAGLNKAYRGGGNSFVR